MEEMLKRKNIFQFFSLSPSPESSPFLILCVCERIQFILRPLAFEGQDDLASYLEKNYLRGQPMMKTSGVGFIAAWLWVSFHFNCPRHFKN